MKLTELDLAEELVSHTYQAHELAKLIVQHATRRDQTRLRVARHRTDAPTTTQQSAPPQQRRRA